MTVSLELEHWIKMFSNGKLNFYFWNWPYIEGKDKNQWLLQSLNVVGEFLLSSQFLLQGIQGIQCKPIFNIYIYIYIPFYNTIEMVHCKCSSMIFEYNQQMVAVPSQKTENIILP